MFDELRSGNSVFGTMRFPLSSPDIQVVIDETLAPSAQTGASQQWNSWMQAVLQNHWTSGHLNIYFVGWVLGLQGQPATAFTTDRADNPPNGRHYVLMNDGGYFFISGFPPDYTPRQIRDYHVLEHEMAHFLLRRTNCPAYSIAGGEHVPNIPQNQNHLLRDEGVPPMFISQLPMSEKREIRCRYSQGLWTAPSPVCTPEPCP